jgi:hypothetical protein
MPAYLGTHRSQEKHDAVFLNEAGALLAQLTLPHCTEGLLKLDATRRQLGVGPEQCLVGLETAHTILAQGYLLVDFLCDRGYCQVYVLPPKMVRRSRER